MTPSRILVAPIRLPVKLVTMAGDEIPLGVDLVLISKDQLSALDSLAERVHGFLEAHKLAPSRPDLGFTVQDLLKEVEAAMEGLKKVWKANGVA